MESLRERYRASAHQVKEKLANFKRDPQGSIFDLNVEIGCLVWLAHPHSPAGNSARLVVNYLISKDNRAIQQHLLTVDTSTVAGMIHAIKEYLAIGNSDQPTCKAIGKIRGLANSHSWRWHCRCSLK